MVKTGWFEDTKTDIGFLSRCHWKHDMNLYKR